MTIKQRLTKLENTHEPQENEVLIRVVWNEDDAKRLAKEAGLQNVIIVEWDDVGGNNDDS